MVRLIFNDYESFYYVLSTLNEIIIHQRCINVLLTKVYNGLFSELMNEVFYLRQHYYNLSSLNVFAKENPVNLIWKTLSSKVRLYHHKNFLKTNPKFGAVLDICVKSAQRYRVNVVYFQVYLSSIVASWHNCAVVKCKWPKYHLAVKEINVSLSFQSKYISYVVIFLVAICNVLD